MVVIIYIESIFIALYLFAIYEGIYHLRIGFNLQRLFDTSEGTFVRYDNT